MKFALIKLDMGKVIFYKMAPIGTQAEMWDFWRYMGSPKEYEHLNIERFEEQNENHS